MTALGQSRRFARFAVRSALAPKRRRRLDQLQSLQTGVTLFADDDVVVHGDTERFCDVDDGLGHLDVGLWRRGIAWGVIVDESIASRNALNTQ